MNQRFRFALLVALATGWFAGGCKTAPPAGDRVTVAGGKQVSAVVVSAEKAASAHAHYAAGVSFELNEQTDAALQEFRQAVHDDPDDETLVLEVSRRFLLNKQPAKALEILELAAARPAATGEVFARFGAVLAGLGKTNDAIAANRTAIKKSPASLAGYQNLFYFSLKNKQTDEALKILDEAGKAAGTDAEFLIGLADMYRNYALQFPTQREAINPRAASILERAEALKPKKPQTRLRLADGLHALGRTEKAAQLYLGLLSQVDDLPLVREAVRARLADIYLRGNDSKLAREQLEAIVRDDPANAQAYFFLGSLAYDEKKWTEAVDYFKKTILFSPNFEPGYYDLAGAQLAANKAEDAGETLRGARKKFPPKFLCEYLLAMVSQRLKNYADAITHFTSAEVLAKAGAEKNLTASFYFEAGIAHERKGDREEAVKYFQKALELQPDFPEAQNYLGYMWAERGENLDRAQELIAKALKAEPKSAAYLDSMGWVLFKQNQPQAALEYILKAVELNGEPDATLYDHLGDIYASLNEPAKARAAWQKSLGVEPNELVKKKLAAPKTP